jgi:hypothetical protein
MTRVMDGLVEVLLGDVPLVDEGHLPPVQPLDGAGGLGWPQVATGTEGGDEVALARVIQLDVVAGKRAEVAAPVQTVLGVGQRRCC